MERTKEQPLTLQLLKDNVPAVQLGQEAIKKLQDPNLTPEEKVHYTRAKIAGTKSQRILILSALPLIKDISSKELQRRSAWGSRVSYEDILQEAIAGFIRGLLSFKVDAQIKSPTNYLGQWINTSIRRQVEEMDHDFKIPQETVERHRRMRAIFSRLAGELKRDPTDNEFLEALNSDKYQADTSKWGRVAKSDTPKKSKIYTQKHIDEMRDIAPKAYPLMSINPTDAEGENEFEVTGSTLTAETENMENIDDTSLAKSRYLFFQQAFTYMRIGRVQKEIIERTFGIHPYPNAQSARDVSMNTGMTQKYVKQIIQSFAQYISLKGGVFHYLISVTNTEEVEDLEFGWVVNIVGEYPTTQKQPITAPDVLTRNR
jgi:DNA-directed RNA polymerase specialized sigma subunit